MTWRAIETMDDAAKVNLLLAYNDGQMRIASWDAELGDWMCELVPDAQPTHWTYLPTPPPRADEEGRT